MKKAILAAFVTAASLTSFGAVAATPSFDFVQASYVHLDAPGASIDGFGLALEKTVYDKFFLDIMAIRLTESSINMTTGRIGAGYAYNFKQAPSVAAFGVIGLNSNRLTGAGRWNESDNGQYAALGARAALNANIEVSLSAERYWWSEDNGTDYLAKGRFYLNPNLSLHGAYRYEDSDHSAYEIGVAYHF